MLNKLPEFSLDAVGLRKGDKPSSLPTAYSNGEKHSKVST